MFKNLKTGLIYRNSKPHVRSIHAYFPSVAVMDNGEMLATLVLGEAFEAVNLRTHLARSRDNGETWQMEGCVYLGTKDRLTSDSSRITALPGGEVVIFMVRHERTDHPDDGLTNPETLGFVPTELRLLRSDDYGHTWPEYLDVMHEPGGNVFFWESKIVEFSDGRLLAVAWVYDDVAHKDRPNHYAISKDGGKIWTKPVSTGLIGQTLTPFMLDDNRVLSVYRRIDTPGLWANLSHLEGNEWVNDSAEPLWGNQVSGLTTISENMSRNFNVLRFGAPCITRLSDGTIFIAFWCYEDCVSVIRWFKFRLTI